MTWQKKTRIAVAVAGLGFAGIVFFTMGERGDAVPPPAPARLDPKAVIESSDAIFRQVRGIKEDYEIKAQRQLMYEDGTSKLINVDIAVRQREGRDFLMKGAEALAGNKNATISLSGDVSLTVSDGFEVHTGSATFGENDGIVRAPGPLTFKRGRMSGAGVGMTYDKNKDILTITEQASVRLVDEGGNTTMEFSGAHAVLSRLEDVLIVEGGVHALRHEQVLESDKATARLTANEEQITYIELRGNSRVVGGSAAFDSMNARDIDLDYTDDGTTLERLVLNGRGSIALAGKDGAPGRQIAGAALTVALAGDAVTSAVGKTDVRLDLPGTSETAARTISAQTLDASGEPGKGLTKARFATRVEYREDAAAKDASRRVARSDALSVALVDDEIASALFTGTVRVEEGDLRAAAGEADYNPGAGSLGLRKTEPVMSDAPCGQGNGPRVCDPQVSVSATTIDLTLTGRKITATGSVRTTLQATGAKSGGKSDAKMPGLMKQEQPVSVNAAALEYDGGSGSATYTGAAQLLQGETSIRAERLHLDRARGDLVATGAARSSLVIDSGISIGRAEEIRYADAARQVEYLGSLLPAPPPTRRGTTASSKPAVPAAAAATVKPGLLAQVNGPQGDLSAERILITLAEGDNRAERLDAERRIALLLDTRKATGGGLTYFAADERYVMTGDTEGPVVVVEACRQTRGKTLTFFKTADKIIVDGNEEIRTQTRSGGGPCPEPRPAPGQPPSAAPRR